MLRKSHTAVVERNTEWNGSFATEPYEAGWAGEAIFFVRALKGTDEAGSARVQISPDGINWCDEGTELTLPRAGDIGYCKIAHFGGWLRLQGHAHSAVTVLVSLSLKE